MNIETTGLVNGINKTRDTVGKSDPSILLLHTVYFIKTKIIAEIRQNCSPNLSTLQYLPFKLLEIEKFM